MVYIAGIRFLAGTIYFSLLHNIQDLLFGTPSLLYNFYGGFFLTIRRPGLKLSTNLQLVPRLRMVELYRHCPN
jgi:hypothetical protein